MILCLGTSAFAQEGLADLKKKWSANKNPSSKMESMIESAACKEYITCQFRDYSGDGFGYGEQWTSKAECSTCSGENVRGYLQDVLNAGYQIMETEHVNGMIKITFQRITVIPPPPVPKEPVSAPAEENTEQK